MTLVAWSDFKAAYPEGKVLDRNTGLSRNYGQNPCLGYDNPNIQPFLDQGPTTPVQLPALARVLAIDLNDDQSPFPTPSLPNSMC